MSPIVRYDGGPSGEQSMSNSDFSNMQGSSAEDKEPKLIELAPCPKPTNPNAGGEPAKAAKKGEKNTKPTNFQCEDCKKYMCSQRSLRRHRTTCKVVQQGGGSGGSGPNPSNSADSNSRTSSAPTPTSASVKSESMDAQL